jgi:hypothetical protein
MRAQFLLVFSLFLGIIYPAAIVSAARPGEVSENQISLDFPNTITFEAVIEGSATINSVVLEYGTRQLTCGEVVALAFPQFTPGKTVRAKWTWDMRQFGSLPPGSTIWWRWRYTDATGRETLSSEQTVTWLDSEHNWKVITDDALRLHWYSGDSAFAQDLLNTATEGLARLETDTGLTPAQPIDLYIYADTYDMRAAILYEPGWTGGLAFPDHNVVIIGIAENDLDWGRKAEVHELTHVLVGHLTFSCLGGVPTWLNEGLAVYSEGDLDRGSQAQLDQAIRADTLLSVRSLSSGFSEISSKANLSYSESYSIVKYLIETHGQEPMTSLLTTLRDGASIDEALLKVYGFNVDGLEDEWRAAIGAPPRAASAQPAALPTPTFVPTIIPISGAPLAVTPTPMLIPASSTDGIDDTDQSSDVPFVLTASLIFLCVACLLGVGTFAVGALIFLIRQNGKAGKNA